MLIPDRQHENIQRLYGLQKDRRGYCAILRGSYQGRLLLIFIAALGYKCRVAQAAQAAIIYLSTSSKYWLLLTLKYPSFNCIHTATHKWLLAIQNLLIF